MVQAVLRGRSRGSAGRLADAAIHYAAMGWPVCPGVFPPSTSHRSADKKRACSCDRIGCPAPGAHPVSPAWQSVASHDPKRVASWWLAVPDANVILVTGRVFDVLDAPAAVGMTALARMEQSGLQPGPVAITGGRAHFFIRTRGTPADETEWWSCHLDCEPEEVQEASGLRWHCRDSYVVAPPSRSGSGVVGRWLRDPARELPDGVRLLEALVDASEEAG